MIRKRTRVAAVAAALATAVLISTPTIASASTLNPYSSDHSNWKYIPTISKTSNHTGDLVGLWQNVMATDGTIQACDSVVPGAAIDGHFGSNTAGATLTWQKYNGLTADGVVGANTWSKAFSRVYKLPTKGWGDLVNLVIYAYDGNNGEALLVKDGSEYYQTGPYVHAWRFLSASNPKSAFTHGFGTPDITFYTC